MYIYGVVLTECGGDDGLLDSAIHHQPHAQAQQQRGNIITITNVWFAHASGNSSLGTTDIEQTWEMLQQSALSCSQLWSWIGLLRGSPLGRGLERRGKSQRQRRNNLHPTDGNLQMVGIIDLILL